MSPYDFQKARLIVREMTEQMVLELVDKALVTDLVELTVGYDRQSLADAALAREYRDSTEKDYYGRRVPKSAHGTKRLARYTSSTKQIMDAMLQIYDSTVDPALEVRRITIAVCEIGDESFAGRESERQLDLFSDFSGEEEDRAEEDALQSERRRQKAVLDIKKKYGKNAILKGTSLEKGATARERNRQIGGHKA